MAHQVLPLLSAQSLSDSNFSEAACGLGTLYAATGQPEQARAALAAAIALYRDMEMGFWLPQAEATLARIQG